MVKFGELCDWGFFKIRCYKKGTVHFEFKDITVWEQFNKHIARINGYPLFEYKKKGAREEQKSNKQQEQFKPKEKVSFTKPGTQSIIFNDMELINSLKEVMAV